MKKFVRVCELDQVEEEVPIAVHVDGFPPLAVYNVEGEYFVTDDNCTHGNGILSEGFQEGGIIECPFHGGAFDIRTGAVTAPPCQTPVRIYPVQIEKNWILIASPPDARSDEEDG